MNDAEFLCNKLDDLFYGEFPCISNEEMDSILDAITILKLLNRSKVTAENYLAVVEHLNSEADGTDVKDFFRYLLSTEFKDKYQDKAVVNMLLLMFCHIRKLCSTAPGVGDIGDDIIGLLDHPLVTPRDSKARVYGFDALWEHSIGVIAGIKLISFWGQTLRNDGITDMGVYRHQLFQNRAHEPVKCPLLANIKHIYGMVHDQINQNLPKFWFN